MGNKHTRQLSTELTGKQIALLKANTKYSKKEIREWHAGFLRDCPTGRLDKKKFVEVYKEFYPNGNAEKYCKYAFNTFDTDNDRLINFDEFLLSVAATSQGDLDDRLEVVFDIYDISNDKEIDEEELVAMIGAMYELVGETDREGDRDPKKRAAEIIEKLDSNGDKKLSKQEFVAGCKSDPVVRQVLAPHA